MSGRERVNNKLIFINILKIFKKEKLDYWYNSKKGKKLCCVANLKKKLSKFIQILSLFQKRAYKGKLNLEKNALNALQAWLIDWIISVLIFGHDYCQNP